MRTKISTKISVVDPNNLEIPAILKLAMGSPTPEKIQEALSAYQRIDHILIGCRVDGKLTGILGARMKDNMATIQHIAVLDTYRHQGIGKLLIQELFKRFAITFLFAETDGESVGFYEKCDFICKPFEGAYGKRISCQKIYLPNAYYLGY